MIWLRTAARGKPPTSLKASYNLRSPFMLSKVENDLLTQTDSGTGAGEYFRRFWLPALMASEVPTPDCPPVRVRLLGEDLVAFRDTQGRVGLMEEFCPHRRS